MSSSTLERTAGPATARPTRVPTAGRPTSTTKAGARSRAEVAARGRTRAERAADRAAGRAAATDASGGTAPFVLLIMVLLTSGLVTTLWLSTAAAADSYRLDAARQATRDRTEEVERLHRDVAAMQSAPALAAAAQRIGMVPAGAPAVILVHPDGTSQVVGTPAKARAAAPPPPPAVPANPATPASPAAPGAQGTAPDPEALANDPRSGVQAATGGAPAPAPAGAGTTAVATGPAAPSAAPAPSAASAPSAAAAASDPATPGGR
jgi:hypothetical protein